MEKLSRVKKFEDLRNTIDSNNDELHNTNVNSSYDRNLENMNASLFKRMKFEEEKAHTPEREKITRVTENENPANDFQNEYLDDFLNEVKQYNLKKGTRECEDTQIDILHQLQSNNRPSRSQYVEDIKEEKAMTSSIEDIVNTMSNEDIAKEVKNLLDESTAKQPILQEPIQEQPVYTIPRREQAVDMPESIAKPLVMQEQPKEVSSYEAPAYQEVAQPKEYRQASVDREFVAPAQPQTSLDAEEKRENLLHQKLVEETQQLRRQLDVYEDELTDLSDGVEKNNRILNVILCCLILALLGVIAFVIIMLVKAGGTL